MSPTVAASYSATRLHFKTAIIEPLAMDDAFRIDTPHGSFQMTKRQFYQDFANVVASESYREKGGYHSKHPPQKALQYLVDRPASAPPTPPTPPPRTNTNRRLTPVELTEVFAPLIHNIRARLLELAGDDKDLHFALRRKLFKELVYDERSKPMQRRALKQKKIAEQNGKCAICQEQLPSKGTIMDRFEAMKGYVASNVRILCPGCDIAEQEKQNYG